MCNPFSWFNGLGAVTEGHEVAFDNVLGVGVVQPEGFGGGKLVGPIIAWGIGGRCEVVHTQ